MEKYESYQVADFLVDEDFVDWVLTPDEISDAYWQRVFARYPDRKPDAEKAREILLNIRIRPHRTMPDDMRERLVADVQDHIDRSPHRDALPKRGILLGLGRWAAVASVLTFMGILVYDKVDTVSVQPPVGLVIKKEHKNQETQRVYNTAETPLLVPLPDKSMVVLDPDSYIEYDETEFKTQRRVYLSGGAFFEVERQEPHMPFVVHTEHLTTKVLGTSFRIAVIGNRSAHRITVNTGLVEVQSAKTVLLVAANQEVVYKVDNGSLSQEDMVEYAPLSLEAVEQIFDFQAARLDTVLSVLAERYNISIDISNPELAKRTITASLGELHLYEKLELISKAVEARYALIDGRIVMTPNENE